MKAEKTAEPTDSFKRGTRPFDRLFLPTKDPWAFDRIVSVNWVNVETWAGAGAGAKVEAKAETETETETETDRQRHR